jgi:hypothetical protein
MTNSLSCRIAVIHADVEAAYRNIVPNYLRPNFIQQLIDCTSFWFEQVEKGLGVTLGHV